MKYGIGPIGDYKARIKELEDELYKFKNLYVDQTTRVLELTQAIEKHRAQTGHNMCWENDEELWAALKDGLKIDHTPPPWPEFMTKCAAYRASKDKKVERPSNVNWKLVEEMFGTEEEWRAKNMTHCSKCDKCQLILPTGYEMREDANHCPDCNIPMREIGYVPNKDLQRLHAERNK